MTESVRLKLEAVDGLLERCIPLLNDVSSSAYFVSTGDLQHSKHRAVENELTAWISKNSNVLPSKVVSPVAALNSRLVEWAYSQGTNATVANFAQDKTESFAEVSRVLTAYKAELLEQLDDSDAKLKIAVAKELKSPWASGLFYLVVGTVVLATLSVVANVISAWLLPLIIIGGVVFVSIIGALQLRQDDRMTEKGFLELMRLSVGALPLLVKRQK